MSNKPINHKPLPAKPTTIPTVIGWTIIVAYVLAAIIFVGYIALTPSRYYKDAVEYYQQNNYESARRIIFCQSNQIPINYYEADYRESRILGIKIAEKGDEVYFGEYYFGGYSNQKLK